MMSIEAKIEQLIDVGALERDPVTRRLSVHPALPSLVKTHNDRLDTEAFVASIPAGKR